MKRKIAVIKNNEPLQAFFKEFAKRQTEIGHDVKTFNFAKVIDDFDRSISRLRDNDIIVVTDSYFSEANSMMLCRIIKDEYPCKPIIVVNIKDPSSKVMITKFFDIGYIDLFLDKPYNSLILDDSVKRLLETKWTENEVPVITEVAEVPEKTPTMEDPMPVSSTQINELVGKIFRAMGMNVGLNGYGYSIEAITYLVEHENSAQITKKVYPAVAEIFSERHKGAKKVSPAMVERSIRHSVEHMYAPERHVNIQALSDVWAWKKPTNTEFLKTIADSILNGWYNTILESKR